MDLKTAVCKTVNKLFPVPRHPFNLQSSGQETYAEWQYKRGEDTIRFSWTTLQPKRVPGQSGIDIGCGGRQDLYYASQGQEIYGISGGTARRRSNALARQKAWSTCFNLYWQMRLIRDLRTTSDTIIMNDAMEHVEKPPGLARMLQGTQARKPALYKFPSILPSLRSPSERRHWLPVDSPVFP